MLEQEISHFLDKNCMDYDRYVIENRAIIAIDGLKPIHRRIIWSMYQDKLTYNRNRTKSVNASGAVLRYSPHGDSSVYQAMVRLANDSVMYSLIDGKGSFGTTTSRDIVAGSARYTEARLSEITKEIYGDIEKENVDMVLNYDETRLEPTVLPTKFPLILANPNMGIAVGIASSIPSFNLKDINNTVIDLIHNKELPLLIPDFPTGGKVLYNEDELLNINKNGLGKVRLRCKYIIENNKDIVITEIPYTTTREVIIEKILALYSEGKLKELIDVVDSSGVDGLRIVLEVRKNTDVEKFMNKLYKLTPLEDSFSCNMNILLNGSPQVLGVRDILKEWLLFRENCVKRELQYELTQKTNKLNILKGLKQVLLDVDKAIKIIKESDEDKVIDNLMLHFSISKEQAETVANMKLRNINEKYILKQIKDIDNLEEEVKLLRVNIESKEYIDNIIITQLNEISNKYSKERKTEILYEYSDINNDKELLVDNYNCSIVVTQKGYIKKVKVLSDNQKLKDGDEVTKIIKANNIDTLMMLTNLGNRYRINISDLNLVTNTSLGDYLPSIISLGEYANIISVVSIPKLAKGYMVFVYENGKVAKVDISSYLSNNKVLANCFSTKSKIVTMDYINNDTDILLCSNETKGLICNTSRVNAKKSRNTDGVVVMKLDDNLKVLNAKINVGSEDKIEITTSKGVTKEVMLNDISPSNNIDECWYQYLLGRNGNQGKFVLNSRDKSWNITNCEII